MGLGVDIVAEIQSQFHGFQPLGFGNAGQRTRRFAFVIIQTRSGHQRSDADRGLIFGSAPCFTSSRIIAGSPLRAAL